MRFARAGAPSASLSGCVLLLLASSTIVPWAGTADGADAKPAAVAGSDVRSFGAVCDGRTDAAPALRRAYEQLAKTGGTIVVPAGVRCAIGGDGVEPRSRVALRCENGGGFVARSGVRALFRTGATLDDWSVTGCDFDLNGVAATAWESSGAEHGGARWEFRDNTVHGVPPGKGEPLSLVRLDCTLASGPCVIAGNTIDRASQRRVLRQRTAVLSDHDLAPAGRRFRGDSPLRHQHGGRLLAGIERYQRRRRVSR